MSLFGNTAEIGRVAQRALTLIEQHMHDCDARALRTDKKVEEQDRAFNEKHRQNTDRLDAVVERIGRAEASARNRYLVIVTTMFFATIGGMGSLIVELIKALK